MAFRFVRVKHSEAVVSDDCQIMHREAPSLVAPRLAGLPHLDGAVGAVRCEGLEEVGFKTDVAVID